MPSPSAEWNDIDLDAELWLDYDPAAWQLPGMSLGIRALRGPVRGCVSGLAENGVRCVRLVEPIRLCQDAPARSARALVLVREATSRGMAVIWEAVCDDGCAGNRTFHHLYPPTGVTGVPEHVVAEWRSTFFPNKCLFRRGPGFVEVRDRRFGTLELFTIDDPDHRDVIEALTEGLATDDVPAAVRDDFAEAGLTAEHAGHTWWLPMRVRRWPFPSLTV